MFGKKRLAKKMIHGVDNVRLVLFRILSDDFLEKYQEKGESFCKTLAGATVNEIFGSQNESSQITFQENKKLIVEGIENLVIKYPELKRTITDAIRVLVQASAMLSGKLPENYNIIFNNAIERGIFIKGGENPNPKTFIKMTEELSKKYL